MTTHILNPLNHDRDSAALTYVYPVVSRRAGGVSVGINLNPNNACNWRCIYCQVPNLTRGSAPTIDLVRLEQELRGFLQELLTGNFMEMRVPADSRRINDIALSGNGEPTSAAEFAKIIRIIAKLRDELPLPKQLKTVLITNGSLLHRNEVQQGVSALSALHGEVWFKLDRASEIGMQQVNDTQGKMSKVREHLLLASSLCPTWLQTCWFALDGEAPSLHDEDEYLDFLSSLQNQPYPLQGVLLYGLARPSMQVEAARLTALPEAHLRRFAARIEQLGVRVKVSI